MILNTNIREFQLYLRQRDDADETPLHNLYQMSKLCKNHNPNMWKTSSVQVKVVPMGVGIS